MTTRSSKCLQHNRRWGSWGEVHEEQTGFPLATSLGSVVPLIKWFRLFSIPFLFFFESRNGGADLGCCPVPKGTPVRRSKPAGNLPGYASPSTHPVALFITSHVSRHPVCSRGSFGRIFSSGLESGGHAPPFSFSRETDAINVRSDGGGSFQKA